MTFYQLFFKLVLNLRILACILITSWGLNAQEINLDQFYNSLGAHNSLGSSSSERLDSLYQAYLTEHNIEEDNGAYQDFIYDYNFFLEKLNKSGKVFSGDVLSAYLNGMKDEILINHPKKDLIQVYLTNFDQLNAFTNDFGSIYVNVATIAKIDSEMKLRVILAHEIAHVLMRHSFKMANLDNHFSKDKFERINQISDFDSHQFSQKQELEADSIAYTLLSKLGYDISNLEDLFESLNTSRNPVFPEPFQLNALSLSNNTFHLDYLDSIQFKIRDEKLFLIEVDDDDSLSTHPSAEARKLLYKRVWQGKVDSTSNNTTSSNDTFDNYRLLAANVLARTLMTEHKYVEGLYLVIQLRDQYPNDADLLKLYVKLQVLITQSKYLFNESSVLNEYGSSCSDLSYLIFRKGLLSIPALEMNILTLSNVLEAQKKSTDTYLGRLSDVSYQFLYKYNPELISKANGETIFSSEKIDTLNLKKRPLLNSDQTDKYEEFREDGYILVDTLIRGKTMIDDFIVHFDTYDELKKNLYIYRKSRDQFEEMLTFDEFIVDFNPDESFRKFRKGKRNGVTAIPDSAVTALVQSDTYVFTRLRTKSVILDSDGQPINLGLRSQELDVKGTIETQDLISEVLQEEEYFSKDLTNLNQTTGKISVQDNYMHYLLTNWIGECLNFEDLIYSVADEEILEYLDASNTEYLVYNFNILKKNQSRKGSSSKYRCLYYNLYFDMKTMGVAYVSKISSSKRPSKKYLRHYFYQAHLGKSKL